MKKLSNIMTIIALILIVALIGGVVYGYVQKFTLEVKNPVATIEVENYGTITVELYPEMAPETVANFIALANNGYYDGKIFHRVVKDFMIQAGKTADGEDASPKLSDLGMDVSEEDDDEYCITGEFLANDYNKNTLKHEEGVIAMARADYTSYSSSLTTESYNSANAQFYIMTKENSGLNGYYAPFGKVTEGMDIVHQIEEVEVQYPESDYDSDGNLNDDAEQSEPVTNVVITSIRVETYGSDYGYPETLDVWNYYDWIYETYGINIGSGS